jgi:hypothetical protein
LTKAKTAHQRRELFHEIHNQSRLLELKLIWMMNKEKDWKRLGFDKWGDYCTAPEPSGGLGISREWATQLALIYQKYVIECGVAEQHLLQTSPRKLYMLIRTVNKTNVEDALAKAKTLSLDDLKRELNGVDTYHCEHEGAEQLLHCKKCGLWKKI